MENVNLFLIFLWLTFIIIRPISHLLTDRRNYGTKKDKSKTLTGWLRKRYRVDLHHIHLGLTLLLIVLFSRISYDWGPFLIGLFGVSISLILDQILPLLKMGNYFEIKMILGSLLLHLLITILFLRINFS